MAPRLSTAKGAQSLATPPTHPVKIECALHFIPKKTFFFHFLYLC